MRTIQLFVLLAVCAGVCLAIDKNNCLSAHHEIYSRCENHPCQNTCEDPNFAASCKYQLGCYPGCICRRGYLRNEDGTCVPERDCSSNDDLLSSSLMDDSHCEENEYFTECGTACPKTCENHWENIPCTDECVKGCFCVEGFVLNNKGDCIPVSECQPSYY